MLKKQSKAICLAMALVFCLSFIAVAPPATQAATTGYYAITTPSLSDSQENDNIGSVIEVDLQSCAGLTSPDVLTMALPSNIEFLSTANVATADDKNGISKTANDVVVYVPQFLDGSTTPNGLVDGSGNALVKASITPDLKGLDITLQGDARPYGGKLFIYINNINVKSSLSGDQSVTFAGSKSTFPTSSVVFAKASSDNGTVATISSAKSFGTTGLDYTNNSALNPIYLMEQGPKVIANGDQIRLRLPSGFKWSPIQETINGNDVKAYFVNLGWGYAGKVAGDMLISGVNDESVYGHDGNGKIVADGRDLIITAGSKWAGASSTAGRLGIAAGIAIDDENVAKTGDVTVHIDGLNNTDVSEQDLVIAKYGSYGATVDAGTNNTLIAGKAEQKLGTFYLTEGLAGSLLTGRTVKLTLPTGVKWWGGYSQSAPSTPTVVTGTKDKLDWKTSTTNNTPYLYTTDSGRTAELSVLGTTSNATQWKFKDLKVDVDPTFTGDVKVTVSGDAGISGDVTVATVKPALTMTADTPTSIVIGQQSQKLADLTLTEAVAGAVAYKVNEKNGDGVYTLKQDPGKDPVVPKGLTNLDLYLTLPSGATWGTGYPTVTVTDGDLSLDTAAMTKMDNDRTIAIPVKSESSKPSTIKVSNMVVTVDRTVPEGDFKLSVSGLAINETGGYYDDNALPFSTTEAPSVVVGKVVTPAPTGTAKVTQFNIGSNIYSINGVSQIMDAAPYIKAGRTYVPVRYLAESLGAQVAWDAATQKVTITKDKTTIELVIGSKTLTKDGTATTMDVAPEITSGRTMLPARWVAEALGATVGWNPSTQTVLIQLQ